MLLRSGVSRDDVHERVTKRVNELKAGVADEIRATQYHIQSAMARIQDSKKAIDELKSDVKNLGRRRDYRLAGAAGDMEDDLVYDTAKERIRFENGVITRNKAFIKRALREIYGEVDQL